VVNLSELINAVLICVLSGGLPQLRMSDQMMAQMSGVSPAACWTSLGLCVVMLLPSSISVARVCRCAGSLSHLEEVALLLQRVQPHELLYEYTLPAATDSSTPATGPAHSTDYKASSDLSSAAAPSTIVTSRPCVRFASAVDRDNLYVRFEVQV